MKVMINEMKHKITKSFLVCIVQITWKQIFKTNLKEMFEATQNKTQYFSQFILLLY